MAGKTIKKRSADRPRLIPHQEEPADWRKDENVQQW
jgi:hypothetical protein